MVPFITAASHLGAGTRGEEDGEREREGPHVYRCSEFLMDVMKTSKQLHTEKGKAIKSRLTDDREDVWSQQGPFCIWDTSFLRIRLSKQNKFTSISLCSLWALILPQITSFPSIIHIRKWLHLWSKVLFKLFDPFVILTTSTTASTFLLIPNLKVVFTLFNPSF